MTFSGREASEGAIWGGLEGVDEAADAEELVWGKLGELLFDFLPQFEGGHGWGGGGVVFLV